MSAHEGRRLFLVRHGRSAHAHAGWIDADGFRAWRTAYEAAGILESERAPEHLVRLTARASRVFSSDAPRSVASARMLAPEREIIVSARLRELDLQAPRLAGLRLPLAAWALAVGARMLVETVRRAPPSAAEAARIDEAAAWLDAECAESGVVVAVTHASFRARLARRLVERGWREAHREGGTAPWSAWQFES